VRRSRWNGRVAQLALIGTLLASSTALAWTPIDGSSPVWVPPVPYFLNNAGSPDLGGFDATEVEVRRGMDDWTRVSCTNLTTEYRGSTGSVPGSYEGRSTIGWIESGWSHGSGAIGVTGPRWGRNIIEADMSMNGVNYTWITGSGRGGNVNTYSIVLHEGGHYYGLGHSDERSATMYFAYQGGIDTLGSDDQNGICALYPGSGTDCTTTGCPSGQMCVSGACEAEVGDGTICSPCSADSECGGASDLCLGYPDGRQYCGRNCTSDADCGGDRCLGTSGGGAMQCGRVVGSQISCTATGGCANDTDCPSGQVCSSGTCMAGGTGGEIGAACTGGDDCQSGLCRGGVCTSTCNWTSPSSGCPSGYYCDADDSTCDTGYCTAGGTGTIAIGEACGSDTECASALCASGRCSNPCVPGGAPGCDAGFACQIGTLPCRGSCQRSGAPGDDCEGNADCTSGICAATETRNFCTDLCDDATPCPDRFTCTPAGDSAVCVPDFGGLGQPCAGNDDCVSLLCADEGGEAFCTRLCDDSTPCPGAFDCVPTGTPGVGACSPNDPIVPMDTGCGCRAAGEPGGSEGAPLFAVFFAMIWGWRRRG